MTFAARLKSSVKSAFWRSPYFCRIAVLYARHLLVERRRVRARIAATGIPLLSRARLSLVKRTDTLFVLGSGSSINRIGSARWTTIGRYDSIGLNFWLFHQFVPTMYYFEMVEGHEDVIIRNFIEIAGRVSARYRDTFKIASEFHNGLRLLESLNDEFRENLNAHLSIPAYIDSDRQLSASIRLLKLFGVFSPRSTPHNLFKHAGSLSSVLCLAVKMNYRRIVLCGIDLASPEYFYQDQTFYPDSVHVQSSIRTPRHESIMPRLYRNAYPADKIVAELKKQILDPRGIELYVENQSSALYPGVPVASDRVWAALDDARA